MLLNQEHQGQKWTCARSNKPLLKHGFNLGLNFMFLEMRITIGLNIDRRKIGDEVNMVVETCEGGKD